MRQTTQKDQVGFNFAYIGADLKVTKAMEFDPAYMKALYKYGYKQALNGYPWAKTPPGLENVFEEGAHRKFEYVNRLGVQ